MLRIGLTGGIGSGKSTVARIFEILGVPVYYADDAAKRLMEEDELVRAAVTEHFGSESYNDRQLNRTYLSSLVFGNPEKLALLNSLTHPATIRDADDWMAARLSFPYIIKEAALIFESGSSGSLDYIIGVSAPAALRIRRTMERSGITREEVIKRMNRQIDEDMKMKLCDFVVRNDEQQPVIPQVVALHEKLLLLSQSK
ncbi:MAG: dephospho-CoA kinase [Chitinophagaceae bacterium]